MASHRALETPSGQASRSISWSADAHSPDSSIQVRLLSTPNICRRLPGLRIQADRNEAVGPRYSAFAQHYGSGVAPGPRVLLAPTLWFTRRLAGPTGSSGLGAKAKVRVILNGDKLQSQKTAHSAQFFSASTVYGREGLSFPGTCQQYHTGDPGRTCRLSRPGRRRDCICAVFLHRAAKMTFCLSGHRRPIPALIYASIFLGVCGGAPIGVMNKACP